MLNDLRYAVRQLIKTPSFTFVAILTLALGIGACTAIFSVVNAVLLHPLDSPDQDRLVVIQEENLPRFPDFSVSAPNYLDWEKQAKSFDYMAAYGGAWLNLTGEGEPQRLVGVKVTAHYFDVMGVKPVLGRMLLPEEDAQGRNHVVVLSYKFWQRVFGGAGDVVGRSIQLNGEPYQIVGVAPSVGFAGKVDVWTPRAFKPDETADDARGSHSLGVYGRLKQGVTVAQAKAELDVIAAQLAKQYPDSNKGWGIFMMPLQDYLVRDVKPVLYTLLGAVGCVLLIACANLANLLLARATARHREISIRAALGAGRGRLIRQLLTESVVLAVCGGAAGVLLAKWGLDALIALAPPDLPSSDIELNTAVLLFSFGLSLVTGLLFGIAPAWLAARIDVNEALKQGTRGSTEGGLRGRLRSALVVIEVTFALVLLGAAGLLTRSFMQLARVDPGFIPENATMMRLSLPPGKYDKHEQRVAFANALLERLRNVPGVQAAGLTQSMPLMGDWVLSFNIEGRPPIAPSDLPSLNYYAVTPDYFRAMGIRLVRGRTFTVQDDANSPRVCLINETLARQFFPNEDPIGKRLNITTDPDTKWREIVGIVGDVKQYGPDQTTTSQAYEPYAQNSFWAITLVIRTKGSPAAVLGALRPAVYAVDKDQPVGAIRPLEEIVADTIARQRFAMLLLTVFSSVALVIAAVGIYGVMAYNVVQRTGEFGIRMALGAQQRDVLRLVLTQGGKLIGLGLVIGLAATLAASYAMRSILFNTSAYDPLTLMSITFLLGVVALVACFFPANRATKVNPIDALRTE